VHASRIALDSESTPPMTPRAMLQHTYLCIHPWICIMLTTKGTFVLVSPEASPANKRKIDLTPQTCE